VGAEVVEFTELFGKSFFELAVWIDLTFVRVHRVVILNTAIFITLIRILLLDRPIRHVTLHQLVHFCCISLFMELSNLVLLHNFSDKVLHELPLSSSELDPPLPGSLHVEFTRFWVIVEHLEQSGFLEAKSDEEFALISCFVNVLRLQVI